MSLTATHTLEIHVEPFNNSDLSDKMWSFWELELLGIEKVEKSVHNKFKENNSFRDGSCKVSLPWKKMHDLCQTIML